jgi:ribonucleoside-diphosphate reductase alpha chain
VLSVWRRRVAVGENAAQGVDGVMTASLDAARSLKHRADFTGWIAVAGRDEYRLALGEVKRIALELGMAPGCKAITAELERQSSAFYAGFLRGFFDADGSVHGAQEKGISIRLAQSDLARLEAVQRMLLRLGIASAIYQERRPAGSRLLPDGKGGRRAYDCAADHELAIAGDDIGVFAERIGFADTDKSARLRGVTEAYRRSPNRERFTAEVTAIDADGEADVFDAEIPGINAFDANGIYVHNCGEQPLPPYGACLLGSINLAALVREPFTPAARLDLAELERIVPLAVRMMDNVVDVSRFPLPQQGEEAKAKRRIGLGVTGLADALILCGARYGSAEAVALTETWLKAIERRAYFASAELAAEKGAFPLFDKEKYLAGETISAFEPDLKDAIARHGVRNALITSIAPTGTISILADNVSSGIEPVFSFRYTRNITMPDGSRHEEEVSDYAYRLYRRLRGDNAPLPEAFVDAQSLAPGDHLVMQAAAQRYIDSSISKTINMPADFPFEAFKDVYLQAYELGCKGCTTYRPNEVTGAVLEPKKDEKPAARQAELPLPAPQPKPRDVYEAGGVVYMTQPLNRPEELPGNTYKIAWPESEHALYITINDIVRDGRRRPFEIFINSKNMEHYAWSVGLTRMISAVFRRGGDVSFVVAELKAVFDPRGGAWMNGRYVPSLLAAIGDVIEKHMVAMGAMPATQEPAIAQRQVVNLPEQGRRLGQCPKCGEAALIRVEGCDQCTNCDYSKCG